MGIIIRDIECSECRRACSATVNEYMATESIRCERCKEKEFMKYKIQEKDGQYKIQERFTRWFGGEYWEDVGFCGNKELPLIFNTLESAKNHIAALQQGWADITEESKGMPEFGNSERKQDALDKLVGKTSITPAYKALVIPKSSDDDTYVTYRKSRLVDSDSKLPIFLPV